MSEAATWLGWQNQFRMVSNEFVLLSEKGKLQNFLKPTVLSFLDVYYFIFFVSIELLSIASIRWRSLRCLLNIILKRSRNCKENTITKVFIPTRFKWTSSCAPALANCWDATFVPNIILWCEKTRVPCSCLWIPCFQVLLFYLFPLFVWCARKIVFDSLDSMQTVMSRRLVIRCPMCG